MDIISIIGTIASVGSIPLAIYVYTRNKENILDKVRREIIKILSYRIASKGVISTNEVQSVINAKLREAKIDTNKLPINEIIEDLYTEIISNPLIDECYQTSKYKDIMENFIYLFQGIGYEDNNNVEIKRNKKDNLSSWISIIGLATTVIASVLTIMGSQLIENLFGFLNANQELTPIIMSLIAGVSTILVALFMQTINRKRERKNEDKQ